MRRDVDGKIVEVAEVAEVPAEGPNDPMRNNCFCGRAHDPFFPSPRSFSAPRTPQVATQTRDSLISCAFQSPGSVALPRRPVLACLLTRRPTRPSLDLNSNHYLAVKKLERALI